MKEATDRQISQYTSKIGANGGAKRWSQKSAAERRAAMAKVRMARINKIAAQLKKERPKASDSWALSNAVFLEENRSGHERE